MSGKYAGLFLAGLIAVGLVRLGTAAEPVDVEGLCPRGVVAPGDTARIERVMAKARRGEEVTVAVIGGSITQGAKATAVEKRYGNLIAAWWREAFPKAQVKFVNAGIGATGSVYGALRAQRDLLGCRPDCVVVEYAVNDRNVQESAETLEGLVRQILKQPQQPAVLLLFMMNQSGGNAQEWLSKIGTHYRLPMVSFRDALWPEIQAGRLAWDTIEADSVHPNDFGHACAARFVTHRLEQVRNALGPDDRLPPIGPLPEPLLSDLFEHVTLLEGAELKPVRNNGWTLDEKNQCWRSDRPGSVIEFELEGQAIDVIHLVVRRAMGRATIQVDEGPAVVRDGWFDQTWGGYRANAVVARDLAPGPHRVRIELLEEKSPESKGHEFCLYGLGAGGVAGR